MFEHCLYFNTTALARVLERQWTAAFKSFGLTPAQAFMLRVILDNPGMLQSTLALTMVITRATATRTLDGLQKMQLIERKPTLQDGRESAIYPTPVAIQMHEALHAASAEVTKRLKVDLDTSVFGDAVTTIRNVRMTLS